MEERRSARIGTVSGLALLAGGTAVAAVAGGAHSVFATILLGLLALGMSHALLVEIKRQARRRTSRWCRHDTINAVLLAAWAESALLMTIVAAGPVAVRAVGLTLATGYAGSCGYFVTERRRFLAAGSSADPAALAADPAALVADPAALVADPAALVADPAALPADPAGSTDDPAGSMTASSGSLAEPARSLAGPAESLTGPAMSLGGPVGSMAGTGESLTGPTRSPGVPAGSMAGPAGGLPPVEGELPVQAASVAEVGAATPIVTTSARKAGAHKAGAQKTVARKTVKRSKAAAH